MPVEVLEELLRTVDVRLHALAVCESNRGAALIFPPNNNVVVHFGLEGDGVIDVEAAAPVTFKAGDLVIVPGGARAVLAAAGGSAADSASVVNHGRLDVDGLLRFSAGPAPADVRTLCAMISPSYADGVDLFQHLNTPLVQDASDGFAHLFDLMLRETGSPAMGTRAVVEAAMRLILLLVLRAHLAETGVAGPLFSALRDSRLVRAVSAILNRPGANHTLQSLAAEAGMSRPVFAQRFVKTFGQTPFEFVQKVRLRHAARLLRLTRLPVATIAESVGFASRSHFSRAFRAAFGADPTKYRRLNASEQA